MLKDYILKENEIEGYFEKLKKEFSNYHSIALFGGGVGGVNTLQWIESNVYSAFNSVKFVFDNNPLKWGTKVQGIDVVKPEKQLFDQIDLLAITCGEGDVILEQLRKMGLPESVRVIIPDISAIDRSGGDFKYIWGHMDELEYVYSVLSDEKSKQVFRNILNFKINHDNTLIEEIYDSFERQYFDEALINYKESDVFVDCGSYIGDTIEYYKKWSKDRFSKIYAIESDDENYKILNQIEDNRIVPVKVAVWNKKTELHFNNLGSGSGYVNEDGKIVVKADTIDNILDGERADFIKMDIEGAEYYALLGANATIEKHKPALMISVYHKQDDFVRIPTLIKSMNTDYRLYFRHYRKYSVQETVCYALPC